MAARSLLWIYGLAATHIRDKADVARRPRTDTGHMTRKETFRVVIAGGGVAALEAMIALRELAEDRVDLTLVAPDTMFVYRPLAVAEPFGLGSVVRVPLQALVAGCGAAHEQASALLVSPADRELHTSRGRTLTYDALVLGFGARADEALPGAISFGGPGDQRAVTMLLEDLEHGLVRRVAFAIPTGVGWTLPLYELALLTTEHIADNHLDAHVVLVTPEEKPLAMFGKDASSGIADLFEERGIQILTAVHAQRFEEGRLHTVGHEPIAVDRVFSLPRLKGRPFDGVPQDADGFIPTDEFGRVEGINHVYAAGDITRFPVKQGGLAAQQADAVAEAIAAEAGADIVPTPFKPVLRGMMLTGRRPAFMRAEIAGGQGETSVMDSEPLWWPSGKVAARYLGAYLARYATSPGGSRYEPSALIL
jgi:sulfide:quinone oxidoreductase